MDTSEAENGASFHKKYKLKFDQALQ